jgi:hypothetical protein
MNLLLSHRLLVALSFEHWISIFNQLRERMPIELPFRLGLFYSCIRYICRLPILTDDRIDIMGIGVDE